MTERGEDYCNRRESSFANLAGDLDIRLRSGRKLEEREGVRGALKDFPRI